MTSLRQQYEAYSTEYLLELRARGSGLSDEAHAAIEAELLARGERVPLRPEQPVELHDLNDTPVARQRIWLKAAGAAVLLVVAGIAGQMVKGGGLVGLVVGIVGIVGYFVYEASKSTEVRDEEAAQAQGLDELMKVAADGDTARAKVLLSFGAQVNVRSATGGTPLMYAARNGHCEMVALLLAAGADKTLTTKTGATAEAIAARAGYSDVVAVLRAG